MVAAPAAADAVRRAKAMPRLRVGLHVVAIEAEAMLPASEVPDLVDTRGRFSAAQLLLGVSYVFRHRVRRQLAAEIRAQFAAFAATGLSLDHANAHKHMHLHPLVGRLMIGIGREFGLRALRIPAEPPSVLAASGARAGFADRALFHWSGLLRLQARHGGLFTNDHCFGLAWSGGMTSERLLRLIPHLPQGVSEIYFHPSLQAETPGYRHEEELAALLDSRVRDGLTQAGQLTSYSELAGRSQ
jgi:chitin disaccharide deacetylase